MKELYINMPVSDFFGWGVCGKNLIRELDKKVNIRYIESGFDCTLRDQAEEDMVEALKVEIKNDGDAPFIHTMTRNDGVAITEEMRGNFKTCCPHKGSPNIGYIFSEQHYYNEENIDSLKALDILVAGSKWNADVLTDYGAPAIAIPQGVNKEIFYPNGNYREDYLKDKFVIFSGGKYEHRKAQDLLIHAVRKLQKKYNDIYLMASWVNIFKDDHSFERELTKVQNVMRIPLVYQDEMAKIMRQSDIGVFPNRIEGGTNLVMMEYMACGKPVIANDSTGQADVIDDEYAFRINGGDLQLVEQMVERLEYAYQNRDKLKEMGDKATKAMDNFSWEKMADRFLEICNV
jgi:glycosyltransferase involved in cell wall biosynthesis